MENKKNEILQVRSDILFHDLFNENDMSLLEWTASQILECDVSKVKGKVRVINIRLPRTNEKERSKYVDLVVEYENQKIIIELNNNYDGFYLRNVLYALNGLSNYYNIDNATYYELASENIYKTILVNLNWYRNKGISEKVPSKKIIFYEYPLDDVYKERYKMDYLMKIININLDYYAKLGYDNLENYDNLYKLLTVNTEDELKKFSKYDELNFYSKKIHNLLKNDEYKEKIMSEEIEENVRAHEKYLGGLFYGREEARAEAEAEIAEAKAETAEAKAETARSKAETDEAKQKLKQTQTLIVKNLLNKNMTDLEIMEITNISIEELDNIKKELK